MIDAASRALLLLRTLKNLTYGQVAARIRLRTQRALYKVFPALAAAVHSSRNLKATGWAASFIPLDRRYTPGFPDARANTGGTFRFLNEARSLGLPPDWSQAGAAQLWRYHLHYFEWAWDFGRQPDRSQSGQEFVRIWRSWQEGTVFGLWDAWSPYVVSVRAWALCGVYADLVKDTAAAPEYRRDLARHLSYLLANMETDVGGNHLIKNLKALIGLGVFLGRHRVVVRAVRRLERELSIQVLPDGGHFERSPSYHCQVLGDLLDVQGLLQGSAWPASDVLSRAVSAMTRWLSLMPLADGDLPRLNDSVRVGPRLQELRPPGGSLQAISVLESTGYVMLRAGPRVTLVADVGLPCPPQLPAHAHADCLSFELHVDGRALIVDTGTSTYEPSARRRYERSTAAHNTIELDGVDQTEVWGTFRAARLATPHLEGAWDDEGTLVLVASHDGYRRLAGSPVHRRTWRLDKTSLRVIDEVIGDGRHVTTSRLHLAGESCHELAERLTIRVSGGETVREACELADDFGELRPGCVLVTTVQATLPSSLVTDVDLSAVLAKSSDCAAKVER